MNPCVAIQREIMIMCSPESCRVGTVYLLPTHNIARALSREIVFANGNHS